MYELQTREIVMKTLQLSTLTIRLFETIFAKLRKSYENICKIQIFQNNTNVQIVIQNLNILKHKTIAEMCPN